MSDSLLFHVSLLFVFDGAVCRRLLFLGESRKNKRTFPENVCLVRKGWIYELMEVTKDCLVFADVGRPSVLHGLSCHWAHLRSLLWLLGRFLRPLCCHRCRVFRFSGDAAGVVLFYTLGIWLGLLYILSSDNNVKKSFGKCWSTISRIRKRNLVEMIPIWAPWLFSVFSTVTVSGKRKCWQSCMYLLPLHILFIFG